MVVLPIFQFEKSVNFPFKGGLKGLLMDITFQTISFSPSNFNGHRFIVSYFNVVLGIIKL